MRASEMSKGQTVKIDGKADVTLDGSFDGKWSEDAKRAAAQDDRPWYAPVPGFKPPAAGGE